MDEVPVSSLPRENSGAMESTGGSFNYKKLIYTFSNTPVPDLHQEHTCESLSSDSHNIAELTANFIAPVNLPGTSSFKTGGQADIITGAISF